MIKTKAMIPHNFLIINRSFQNLRIKNPFSALHKALPAAIAVQKN
jgi:hypothetical protein